MRSVVFALAVVGSHGCSRGTPVTPSPPTRTPYLPLFAHGRVLALAGMSSSATDPARRATRVRCTVAEVKQVGDAHVSRLACDEPHASLLVAGTWVAMPAGLYHPALPIDEPDELALLGDEDLLIAAIPAERDHAHVLDRARETVEAFPHAASWCVRQSTTAGRDRRGFTLCFDGKQVTGIADDVGSATDWQRVAVGDCPPEPTEPEEE